MHLDCDGLTWRQVFVLLRRSRSRVASGEARLARCRVNVQRGKAREKALVQERRDTTAVTATHLRLIRKLQAELEANLKANQAIQEAFSPPQHGTPVSAPERYGPFQKKMARWLLEETPLSLREVADRCGVQSPSTLLAWARRYGWGLHPDRRRRRVQSCVAWERGQ